MDPGPRVSGSVDRPVPAVPTLGAVPVPARVTSRDATFQLWQVLLTNRAKRTRAGELLVQGVRPLTVAVEQGWTVRALLHDGRGRRSAWASDLMDRVEAPHVQVAPELMAELGEKDGADGTPELLAVVAQAPDHLDRIDLGPRSMTLALDRLSSPGNLGTLLRSADAFGATGVAVTGHAADPYDPRCVRASTGSVFAVPVVRVPSYRDLVDRIDATAPRPLVVGTDERGAVDVRDVDLTGPVLLVVGNETGGMSAAWRERCDVVVGIPMAGTASSLNAATAGSVLLYEAMRRRHGWMPA
jgi:tRNA G18 (ribose-2'-O)-methylase SpoU